MKPNTYTQLHIQFVFAVQFRASTIIGSVKPRLEQYLSAATAEQGHKLLQINCQPDHVHLLTGFRPHGCVASFMQSLKSESSFWMNNNRLTRSKFAWQGGYGAFSYTKRDVPMLINYIQNQDEHHKKTKFIDEYRDLLEEFDLEFDNKFLFQPLA